MQTGRTRFVWWFVIVFVGGVLLWFLQDYYTTRIENKNQTVVNGGHGIQQGNDFSALRTQAQTVQAGELVSGQGTTSQSPGVDPAEVFVAQMSKIMPAHRPRIREIEKRIRERFEVYGTDYDKAYSAEDNEELWKEFDMVLSETLAKTEVDVKTNEGRINKLLLSWNVQERPEWDWGEHISIKPFDLRDIHCLAVTYEVAVQQVGGYAVNSLRVLRFGDARKLELVVACTPEHGKKLDEWLDERRLATGYARARLPSKGLRLDLVKVVPFQDSADILSAWTYPTGMGFLVWWRFDGIKLSFVREVLDVEHRPVHEGPSAKTLQAGPSKGEGIPFQPASHEEKSNATKP